MTDSRLVDAVTLRHFGITEHLATLKHILSAYLPPYWTDAVRSEILAGIGQPDCNNEGYSRSLKLAVVISVST